MDLTPLLAPWGPGHALTSVGHGNAYGSIKLGATSGAWPLANMAIYIPVRVDTPVVVTKLFVVNGSAVTGNVDIGLYTLDYARLLSTGSTAQSGTNAVQSIDVTDTPLDAGLYYLALALSSGGATTFRQAPATVLACRVAGQFEELSALPLPATMTPAASANAYVPLFGALLSPTTVI